MSLYRLKYVFLQRPWLISLILIVILSLWLSMGMANAGKDAAPPHIERQKAPQAKVEYQTFEIQSIAKTIDLYGRTAPNRESTLGAEISGKIVKLLVDKGSFVDKGQAIAQIDEADLELQLQQAKANLEVREKEFKAAKSLKRRGLQGEVAYSTAQANFVQAQAMVKKAQHDVENTFVRAPFSGVVDDLIIEVGDFVNVGSAVAKIVDLSVLVVEADVSERHAQDLSIGQKASIRLLDGKSLEGSLRYISKVSSVATNTFPIEIEIPNPEQRVPAGMSAEVKLNLQTLDAIKVSSAMLALDEDGNLGVKTLQEDRVHFVPIQLVKAEQDGVWLTGFPPSVDIITRGQGFVRDGDKVIAVKSKANR